MPLPPLTPEQRAASLEKAVRMRKERAAVKERLKTGQVSLPQVLKEGETSDVIGRMRVAEVLQIMPGVGKLRAQQVAERADVSETRRIRGLGPNQRAALAEHFAR